MGGFAKSAMFASSFFPALCSDVLEITKAPFWGVLSFLEGKVMCFDNSLEN